MKTIKEDLYNNCQKFVGDRLRLIQQRIASIQESLHSETKSSAGDKHETGRAMLQLEREKLGVQLAEVQKLQQILSKVDILYSSEVVRLGSVVETSEGNFFLSISIGEINMDKKSYYAIATNTPMGKLLIGKNVGDICSFNNKNFKIERVF